MIYFDPTETANSKEWAHIFASLSAEEWPGLESMTGADMVVLPQPYATVPAMLKRHIKHGALVQRKSGHDLVNSIPHLDAILQRMLEHTTVPFLLVDGNFTYEPGQSTVVINGRPTEWDYASYAAALQRWQMRGGMLIHTAATDENVTALYRLDRMVISGSLYEEHFVRKRAPLTGGIYDPKPWRNTLSTIPGIGPDKADKMADEFDNLADALEWLTDSPFVKGEVKGIGPKTKDAAKEYFGIREES